MKNRKKRRKARRSLLLWLLIAGGVVILLSFLLWPLKSRKFQIVFDQDKIVYRENYLAEKVDSAVLRKKQLNIILIIADDLGKTDISLYGSPYVKTTNMDAIGLEGVTFNEGYISSPICSPSRAGLMTGRYQQRFGFELNIGAKVRGAVLPTRTRHFQGHEKGKSGGKKNLLLFVRA